MAGGKPDLDAGGDSLRQWQVNSDAGTLQGWGVTSGASATPAQAATAESFEHSEVAAQTSASATYCPLNPAHQSEEPSGKDGDSDDSIDPQRLQALLRDNAAFFEVCNEAMKSASEQGTILQLSTVQSFSAALNYICNHCGIEPVEPEEADDLWDGPMDAGVFYQFAREYFGSLCRALTMDISLIEHCAAAAG
ncbi:unnamed protein product [Cladocopium goreaui]|uniref:Uncharacterized protein n=1 Tax=Cladocopium goreaui TaxID=2562237 RepID=A0A9P1CXM9_9DINO|nr:unnamed protein product [Cladocopium goreaui]